jgi:hypothetical protein
MLSYVLYGIASLQHGNLKLTAKAAGRLGEGVSLTINSGASLQVAVTIPKKASSDVIPALFEGDIVCTVTGATTEQQLLNSLKQSALFKYLCRVELTEGDGTDIVAALSKTNLVASAGLRHALEAKTGIVLWGDRDLKASSTPVGILMPFDAEEEYKEWDTNTSVYKGKFYAGIAFQHDGNEPQDLTKKNKEFEIQNILLDRFRQAFLRTLTQFKHPNLSHIGPVRSGYGNELKDEASGSVFDRARLRIAAECEVKWTEQLFDPDELTITEIQSLTIALWREPDFTDVQIKGDGEELDETIVLEPEE